MRISISGFSNFRNLSASFCSISRYLPRGIPSTVSGPSPMRFNFSTGDAAGQNMVGRATLAACQWIQEHHPGIVKFYLEANFATDKKASDINRLRTRGKRVTAEAVIGRDILKRRGYRWEPGELARRGAWCTEVAEEAFEAECAFLRDDIYRGKDAAIDARLLTAFERYSVRSVG